MPIYNTCSYKLIEHLHYTIDKDALYAPDTPPMTTSPSASFFAVPLPFVVLLPFVDAVVEAGLDLDLGFPFVFSE